MQFTTDPLLETLTMRLLDDNQRLRNNLAAALRFQRSQAAIISDQACRIDSLKHERDILLMIARLIQNKHYDQAVGRTAVDAARTAIAQHNRPLEDRINQKMRALVRDQQTYLAANFPPRCIMR